MAVLYTFGKPVLRRYMHCEFMRSALLDMPPRSPQLLATKEIASRDTVGLLARSLTRPALSESQVARFSQMVTAHLRTRDFIIA